MIFDHRIVVYFLTRAVFFDMQRVVVFVFAIGSGIADGDTRVAFRHQRECVVLVLDADPAIIEPLVVIEMIACRIDGERYFVIRRVRRARIGVGRSLAFAVNRY